MEEECTIGNDISCWLLTQILQRYRPNCCKQLGTIVITKECSNHHLSSHPDIIIEIFFNALLCFERFICRSIQANPTMNQPLLTIAK